MSVKVTYEEYKNKFFNYEKYERKPTKNKNKSKNNHNHKNIHNPNKLFDMNSNNNDITNYMYNSNNTNTNLCKIFTMTQVIVNMYETKIYQTTVKLFCNADFKESTFQPITVLVPVNVSCNIPVSILHYTVSYTEYMSTMSGLNKNDIVFQSTKYTTQFGVDDTCNNKKQIWNVDIVVLDIYSE
jgi:hypothetical protein